MTSLLPDRNKLRVFAASLKDLGGHAAEAFDRTLSEMHLRLDAWRDSGIERIMAEFVRDVEEIGRIAARSERFGKPIGKKIDRMESYRDVRLGQCRNADPE